MLSCCEYLEWLYLRSWPWQRGSAEANKADFLSGRRLWHAKRLIIIEEDERAAMDIQQAAGAIVFIGPTSNSTVAEPRLFIDW